MKSLITLYDKYKSFLEPGCWWKLNLQATYRYRKILKVDKLGTSDFVYYKDSIVESSYRLDYFLENHTPITSRGEILYAQLNHFTSGFFY